MTAHKDMPPTVAVAEPTLKALPDATGTMTAIVHDLYATSPEDVLRLEQVDRPTIGVAGRLPP